MRRGEDGQIIEEVGRKRSRSSVSESNLQNGFKVSRNPEQLSGSERFARRELLRTFPAL